jgi:flagellar hook-length control protein FliK
MNTVNNPLFGALNNKTGAAAASDRASLLAGNGAGEGSSNNFAQMLRDSSFGAKPPQAPVMPAAQQPQAAPAPSPTAADKPAQPTPSAPASADGKTETQRQEARMNARRGSPDGSAPVRGGTKPPADNAAGAAQAGPAKAATDQQVADASAQDQAGKVGRKEAGSTDDSDADDGAVSEDGLPSTPTDAAMDAAPPAPNPQIMALLARADLAGGEAAVKQALGEASGGDKVGAAGRGHGGRGDAAHAASAQGVGEDKNVGIAAPDTAAVQKDFASELQQVLPQGLQGALQTEGRSGRGEGASFEALMAAHAAQPGDGGTTATAGTADAPVVTLAQPLHDPGFASELGARVSLLAADGIQEAQLHLNPAEMGPVAVQIVVDGQQAQISFHAQQADTRAALEQSLPDLAAALRDSGLTLTGGGVFQQAQDSGGSARRETTEGGSRAGRSERGNGGDEAVAATSRRAAPRASRGVLDLYA